MKNNKTNTFEYFYQTKDHSLSVPEERKRILNTKLAEITPILDHNTNKPIGPDRIFKKGGNGPGLMMSRTIGDLEGHELGIIATPDVNELILDFGEYVVISASDGLWDKVKYEKIIEIINQYYLCQNVKKILDDLLTEAKKEWRNTDDVIDDITIAVVLLSNVQIKKMIN